jgi:hypothetical protein
MADYAQKRFGKRDVEDAVERLDMVTKKENLMTAARNLEATHHIDVNVKTTQELMHGVDDKVTTIEVVQDVDGNVKATKELTRGIHDNV